MSNSDKLLTCPFCYGKTVEGARICPHCGKHFSWGLRAMKEPTEDWTTQTYEYNSHPTGCGSGGKMKWKCPHCNSSLCENDITGSFCSTCRRNFEVIKVSNGSKNQVVVTKRRKDDLNVIGITFVIVFAIAILSLLINHWNESTQVTETPKEFGSPQVPQTPTDGVNETPRTQENSSNSVREYTDQFIKDNPDAGRLRMGSDGIPYLAQ